MRIEILMLLPTNKEKFIILQQRHQSAFNNAKIEMTNAQREFNKAKREFERSESELNSIHENIDLLDNEISRSQAKIASSYSKKIASMKALEALRDEQRRHSVNMIQERDWKFKAHKDKELFLQRVSNNVTQEEYNSLKMYILARKRGFI